MFRNLVIANVLFMAALLVGCSNMKPMGSASSKPVTTKPLTAAKPEAPRKSDIRFLDEITINNQQSVTAEPPEIISPASPADTKAEIPDNNNLSSENVSSLQAKYATLIGTSPEMLENVELLKSIDYWYGTRYRMGGTSKSGVDCSAFVQAVYLSAYAMSIPRTAFEQFRITNRISAVEMKEGDLVFFNTTGGVSHVGIYLGNNKFVHASSSKGVTVSDLFETYYLRRFLGVGRIEKPVSKQ